MVCTPAGWSLEGRIVRQAREGADKTVGRRLQHRRRKRRHRSEVNGIGPSGLRSVVELGPEPESRGWVTIQSRHRSCSDLSPKRAATDRVPADSAAASSPDRQRPATPRTWIAVASWADEACGVSHARQFPHVLDAVMQIDRRPASLTIVAQCMSLFERPILHSTKDNTVSAISFSRARQYASRVVTVCHARRLGVAPAW